MDEFDDLEDDLEEDEVENFKEEKFDVDEEDWEEDVEIEVLLMRQMRQRIMILMKIRIT